MPKAEPSSPAPADLSAAMAAADSAEVDRLTKDLTDAVSADIKAAPPRKRFTAHSQAASERLLTEERAIVDTLNDLDAKIWELQEQREDAHRAYTVIQTARESLGGGK